MPIARPGHCIRQIVLFEDVQSSTHLCRIRDSPGAVGWPKQRAQRARPQHVIISSLNDCTTIGQSGDYRAGSAEDVEYGANGFGQIARLEGREFCGLEKDLEGSRVHREFGRVILTLI